MTTMPKKSAALRLRNSLVRAGASENIIAAALASINPKPAKPFKISNAVKKRIGEILTAPGAKCVLVRSKKGVRVWTADGLASASAATKARKPWLHRKNIKKADDKKTTTAYQEIQKGA